MLAYIPYMDPMDDEIWDLGIELIEHSDLIWSKWWIFFFANQKRILKHNLTVFIVDPCKHLMASELRILHQKTKNHVILMYWNEQTWWFLHPQIPTEHWISDFINQLFFDKQWMIWTLN